MSGGDGKGSCATELPSECIELTHGSGGIRSQKLIQQLFVSEFERTTHVAQALTNGLEHDASVLPGAAGDLAVTTDSYVVSPLFFPGGDIGQLAVTGTLNDLAVVGAQPLALTASFILEEGLPLETLRRVVASMATVAQAAGVPIATGDTKVVEKGRGDGVYITTTGVGSVRPGLSWQPQHIRPGDRVLVSGDLGRHGITVLCEREGLELRGNLESDCAVLWPAISTLLPLRDSVRCLRDITRGGLAITLNELASAAGVRIVLDEAAIPVSSLVQSSCELLGLDPLYVACEGRFLAIVDRNATDDVLKALRGHPLTDAACVVGEVEAGHAEADDPNRRAENRGGYRVVLRNKLGTNRVVDWRGAEQMPRIC